MDSYFFGCKYFGLKRKLNCFPYLFWNLLKFRLYSCQKNCSKNVYNISDEIKIMKHFLFRTFIHIDILCEFAMCIGCCLSVNSFKKKSKCSNAANNNENEKNNSPIIRKYVTRILMSDLCKGILNKNSN